MDIIICKISKIPVKTSVKEYNIISFLLGVIGGYSN